MKAFQFVNATSLSNASGMLKADPDARILAGGIDLLSELKEHIIEPDLLVNIKTIPGLNLLKNEKAGLTIGSLVTLSQIEQHPAVRRNYSALAEAAVSVASPQIRNVGTIGGNLCQRPRCWYYRDEEILCIKKGGSKCYAAQPEGRNKFNAILGGGPSFIVHPSDCATALVALDARVRYQDAAGKKHEVPAVDFFVLPREAIMRENILRPGDIVTAIFIPAPAPRTRTTYLKFKEKESMDWAVSAVAVRTTLDAQGRITDARVVLGGVAPIPWRSREAEALLRGKRYTEALGRQAAAAALSQAKPLSENAYKIPLTRTLVRRALQATAARPA